MTGPGAGPDAHLRDRRVVVAGAGVSGRAAASLLRAVGARVRVVDARGGPGVVADDRALPPGTDLVVTSPGWRPDAPLLAAAAAAGVPVWGEVELAWRLRPAGQRWLAVTGTNGKTTATGMLAAVLTAAGLRSAAAGNIGTALADVVRGGAEVLAVELSSFQLHWTTTVAPEAAAVINVAPDHLDWHGSYEAYARDKARVWGPGTLAVYGADDPGASALAAGRPGAVGVTAGEPADGMLGVRAGRLVDAAFGGGPLLPAAELPAPGPHNLLDALVAAALARAAGVPVPAVAAGLRAYRPGRHRIELVAEIGGVRFVDDSKGTNPHATAAALATYPDAVWIAGGLAKGAGFDDLVRTHAGRLRGAVLIGTCAPQLAESLGRHAAQVPVIRAADLDNAVTEAFRLARPSGTVLLSPAAASMDMFRDYADRGEQFAAIARQLGGEEGPARP